MRKARREGEGGFVANYNSLEELGIPPNQMGRPVGGERFLYDVGPGVGRIPPIGAVGNIGAPMSETVWAEDGTFKVRPKLRAQLYAIRALVGGYCLPCVYASPPPTG